MAKQVSIAFNPQGVVLPLANILPLKQVKPVMRSSKSTSRSFLPCAKSASLSP